MNTKHLLSILTITLAVLLLVACGNAAPAAPTSEPATAPPPATPEPVDPAAIAQKFYKAVNDGDIEVAMALVVEDIKVRGGIYLTGKESFRSYIQGKIKSGWKAEISDLVVEGDKVTYNWTDYNANGYFAARGVETLQVKDGLIIFIEGVAQ